MGEEAKPKVLSNVNANIVFRGPVLWILACAILVASVGLNVNSTAVIIGAMLISPLMGPIIGAGFGLAIYDFILLKRSLKNLLIATVVSIAVSAIYFFISPFKEAQSELLARTAPNIYDVLIAFFGGLAGVIAVTRVEKGLPVAGVAIATALMPPLCTAGYGLGTGNYMYFLGALFLYTINCTFICIATYLIVKYMKYPAARQVDKKQEKQVKYFITIIVVLMIVPSGYFAYQLFQRQRFKQNVDDFVRKEFLNKGNTIIHNNNNFYSSPKTVELAFLVKKFSTAEMDSLEGLLPNYGLTNTDLIIKQDTSIYTLLNEYNKTAQNREEAMAGRAITEVRRHLQAAEQNKALLSEVQILFPEVQNLSLADHQYLVNDSNITMPVLVLEKTNEMNNDENLRLRNWLITKLSVDTLLIFTTIREEEE